ncbi:MAG: hypothetical protein R3B48_27950 [Kofleriaceae bacterium]
MSTELVTRRDYLQPLRRFIVTRAVAGAFVGALPIPFFDDWAVGVVLGRGYRRIAASHQIDLDDRAVNHLVFGKTQPTSVFDLALGSLAVRLATQSARRVLLAVSAMRRARSAARTFATMTLFDHYCARLHTGLGLDPDRALALRAEIDRALDGTDGALAFHPFRKGIASALRASVRAPLELADVVSGGALRRLLARRSDVTEAEVVDELEEALDRQLASEGNFLTRAVTAVELQLSAESNPFLEAALENFDRWWRAKVAAETPPSAP